MKGHGWYVKEYSCSVCGATFIAAKCYKEHFDHCHKHGPQCNYPESDYPQLSCSAPDEESHSVPSLDPESMSELTRPEITEGARLSDLCRLLEGQHRCSKAAVDAVVQGVAEIFEAKQLSFDTSKLSSNKARKCLYEQTDIYIKLFKKVLKNGSKAYYVPLKPLLHNLLKHPETAKYLQQPVLCSSDSLLRDFSDGDFRAISHVYIATPSFFNICIFREHTQ